MDTLVVGAGFAGATAARCLAELGHRVLVIDRRPHVAGNAYDRLDANGVLVHEYGPHIFHTNSERVFAWLSRFTDWRPYEHRVRAVVQGRGYPLPINRTTINQLYGLQLDEAGVAAFLERVREPRSPIRTSEDVVLNSVGRDLCEKFFRGYTRKQWGLDLSELAGGVAARIPTRTNDDDRYFTDHFQSMPAEGYTRMFERILDHPNIVIRLNTDFRSLRSSLQWDQLFYSGPIDEYFDFRFGKLPYRSLSFEHEHLPRIDQFQSVGTVNFPNDQAYTRITEFKHLTGQQHAGTSIVREYPEAEGDPYYPVPRPENQDLYKQYEELASQEQNVSFIGRLAQYKYFNMDQVVAQALSVATKSGFDTDNRNLSPMTQPAKQPISLTQSSVCVALVTFNRKDLLIECVSALLRQTRPVDLILIVDNASNDGTGALLESTGIAGNPLVRIHREEHNLGGAGGFASGMKIAHDEGYDWVWLMDDDAEPALDALAQAIAHEHEPSVAAIASFKVSQHDIPQNSHMLLDSGQLAQTVRGQHAAYELSFSSFVGILVRKQTIISIGLPRAEFFINRDDNEYCWRMRKVGRILLAPSSIIVHKELARADGITRTFMGRSSDRQPLQKFIFRYFEMRNLLLMYGLQHSRSKMIVHSTARAMMHMAAVIAFRDSRPFLRWKIILKAHTDGIRAHFDNRYPFRMMERVRRGK